MGQRRQRHAGSTGHQVSAPPLTVPITPPPAFLTLVLPAGGPGSGGIRLVQDLFENILGRRHVLL